MPVYNKPTIQTSGNLSGNGRFDNPVALKDKINLTEITASQLKITGTASIAQLNTLSQTELLVGDKYIVIMSGGTDHLSLDGSGILWGSGSTDPTVGPRGENANILFNGTADRLEIFPGISSSFISGTFIGNGANLTNILPNISESHVVYVSSHATNAGADGTLKKPFQTVTGALQHIENNINPDEPVLVNLLPGTYDSFTVTRHDTYFKSDFGRDRQRAVTVNGPVIVATDGTQKYNDIIGFEGIFFNTSGGENSVPVVEISGSGKGVTYFDDCYIASSGSAECLKLNNTLTFDNNKLVLRNTTFLGQKMGPDLLSINGGDAELDTCKFYYSSGPVSTGSAVVATGDSYVVADRCLVDVRTNDYPIDLQSATSASVFTNCAIGSTGISPPGLLYTTKPLTLWNILFTGNTILLTGSSPYAQIYYSSLNSAIPLTASGVTMNPLAETHGRVIASALSGNLSSSYLVGAVPVNRGGTGATSFTSASLLIGNATDAFGTINPATSGNLLVSNGTTWTSIGSGSIGGVTGGTTNYIPLWENSTSLTTSSIRQNATQNVGVKKTASSDYTLTVSGTTYSDSFRSENLVVSAVSATSSSIRQITKNISYLELLSAAEGPNNPAKLVLSSSNVNNTSGSIEFRTNDIVYANKQAVSVSTDITLTPQYPFIVVTPLVSGCVVTLDLNAKYAIGTRITIVNGSSANSIAIIGGTGIGKVIPVETASDFILCSEFDRAWVPIS